MRCCKAVRALYIAVCLELTFFGVVSVAIKMGATKDDFDSAVAIRKIDPPVSCLRLRSLRSYFRWGASYDAIGFSQRGRYCYSK